MEQIIANLLLGKQFRSMHRACDMLCLNIGGEVMGENIKGEKVTFPEFSFHVQTQWRFVKNNQIKLTSRDIYTPFCNDVPSDWDFDIFGRPENQSSIFDVVKEKQSRELQSCTITDFTISPLGDIKITFSDSSFFETFTSTSKKQEVWRFINFKTDEHIVFYDEPDEE